MRKMMLQCSSLCSEPLRATIYKKYSIKRKLSGIDGRGGVVHDCKSVDVGTAIHGTKRNKSATGFQRAHISISTSRAGDEEYRLTTQKRLAIILIGLVVIQHPAEAGEGHPSVRSAKARQLAA